MNTKYHFFLYQLVVFGIWISFLYSIEMCYLFGELVRTADQGKCLCCLSKSQQLEKHGKNVTFKTFQKYIYLQYYYNFTILYL